MCGLRGSASTHTRAHIQRERASERARARARERERERDYHLGPAPDYLLVHIRVLVKVPSVHRDVRETLTATKTETETKAESGTDLFITALTEDSRPWMA